MKDTEGRALLHMGCMIYLVCNSHYCVKVLLLLFSESSIIPVLQCEPVYTFYTKNSSVANTN